MTTSLMLVKMHNGLQILHTSTEMLDFTQLQWTTPSQMITLCIFIATCSTEQRVERVDVA
jgi:hypothetical protein